jgi:hypothetical protein
MLLEQFPISFDIWIGPKEISDALQPSGAISAPANSGVQHYEEPEVLGPRAS